ncbi:tRNA lysidine(34) synthetase TilS, partial [Bacteroidales bacterium OttesenSCG-928-A14]|nr:tRNA lysidine(34) synthetase TilS [Bacteroidales bacterium OttesenSCG-928-A14]
MKEKFLTQLTTLVGDPFSKKFLLAVSGGKDSSVLAHLFHFYNIPFEIAHCNFHLREEESDCDMEFVMEMGLEYGCGVHLKEFYHDDFQSVKGKSIEMIAREFRYRWFEKLSGNFDFIVTAHTANDNAETLLLNLSRGTGLKGMTGIPLVNGKIIRPLLGFSTQEIETYIQQNSLLYCVDRTNLTDDYQRNKIRHNIIPQLEGINPSLIHTLSQNIEIFRKQYRFYSQHIQKIKEELLHEKSDYCYIEKNALLAYQGDTELIMFELFSPFGFNKETIHAICENAGRQSGKRYYSATHIVIQERKKWIITQLKELKKQPKQIKNLKSLEKYGFEIAYLQKEGNMEFEKDPFVWYVDAELLRFPLILRNWEHGDVFQPFGMKGKKKVSDFFNDQKIDNYSKN